MQQRAATGVFVFVVCVQVPDKTYWSALLTRLVYSAARVCGCVTSNPLIASNIHIAAYHIGWLPVPHAVKRCGLWLLQLCGVCSTCVAGSQCPACIGCGLFCVA